MFGWRAFCVQGRHGHLKLIGLLVLVCELDFGVAEVRLGRLELGLQGLLQLALVCEALVVACVHTFVRDDKTVGFGLGGVEAGQTFAEIRRKYSSKVQNKDPDPATEMQRKQRQKCREKDRSEK